MVKTSLAMQAAMRCLDRLQWSRSGLLFFFFTSD